MRSANTDPRESGSIAPTGVYNGRELYEQLVGSPAPCVYRLDEPHALIDPKPTRNDTNNRLNTLALQKLVATLEGYGNVLTPEHKLALQMILEAFTALASKKRKGRWGYDLGCGGGKTEATKAWTAALCELGFPYSVEISSSRIEDLDSIKRSLMADYGVPEHQIGLIHSRGKEVIKDTKELRYLPPTEGNDNRPILLLTHAQLKGPKDIKQFTYYQGQPRSVVIYDESLLIARKYFLELSTVTSAVSALNNSFKYRADEPDDDSIELRAHRYAQQCLEVLDDEWANQGSASTSAEPKPIRFPKPDDDLQDFYRHHGHPDINELKHLVEYADLDLRVVRISGTEVGGYCTYELALPDEIDRMVVLDASIGLRILSTLNGTVQTDEEFDGRIKRYNDVTIRQLVHRSGRGAIFKEFLERQDQRKISKEIADVVRQIPENEAIAVWSFKSRHGVVHKGKRSAVNVLGTLEDDLKHHGIDTDAKVIINGEEKPRFAWLSYGQETSSNNYLYCQNSILVGVLHRSDIDLAAEMIGEKRDLSADITKRFEIQRTECAHRIYQAINRSACRIIKDGRAQRTNVWLIHHDENFEDLLRPHMPGVKWREWKPNHLNGRVDSKAKKVSKTTAEILGDLRECAFRAIPTTDSE